MPKGNGKSIPQVKISNNINTNQASELLKTLEARFNKNMQRHKGVDWNDVNEKLKSNKNALIALYAMEETGGEPDLVVFDNNSDEYIFCDCSKESPDRRSICYDKEGEDKRIKNGIKPGGSAIELAKEMGIEILDEEIYRKLQEFGEFDTKTSSWIETPSKIRKLGGAIFCDRRYNTVFKYHNGAESFYASRGFRGMLKV